MPSKNTISKEGAFRTGDGNMTSYQKKTEKQKERAEILFKEYPDISIVGGNHIYFSYRNIQSIYIER